MHIRHANSDTEVLGVEGHQFTAIRPGVFDVPDEIGERLLGHGIWTRYRGEPAYEVRSPSGATLTPVAELADAEGERQQHVESPEPASEPESLIDWAHEGREAARRGDPRAVPVGVQPMSRAGREWRRGYDEAKPRTAG